MFKNSINYSAGQVSRTLLILAVIILVAVAISYSVIKIAERPPKAPDTTEKIHKPVYDETLAEIRFIFQEAKDYGGVLKGSQSRNPQWQQDLETTERFIRVTVAAQNKGKENTKNGNWDIENIVDSEGRNYIPISADQWMPEKNRCGEMLKPEFEPVPCSKYYEVSKISTGLKIRVENKQKGANILLDLIVTN
ncbi:MAG: hypothetical protein HYT36_03650 [Candidatus Staskawiczbacteria bacterium]|nr:hypothetical protein [Candidatus Staskawiczbacteria bacterium]